MPEAGFVGRLREEMDRPPFNRWLAPRIVGVDAEARTVALSLPFRAEFSFHPTEPCFHGGVIAALADAAGHAAVAVFHGKPTPTITLQVDFLATARGDALHARGMLRKLGRSVSRADVELDCACKLVALARVTFSTKPGD
jgi:uncharacterized protein (TIGR00369 family)